MRELLARDIRATTSALSTLYHRRQLLLVLPHGEERIRVREPGRGHLSQVDGGVRAACVIGRRHGEGCWESGLCPGTGHIHRGALGGRCAIAEPATAAKPPALDAPGGGEGTGVGAACGDLGGPEVPGRGPRAGEGAGSLVEGDAVWERARTYLDALGS